MSISIRHQIQLDNYYASRQIYPLTMENVSKVTLADPSSMPLARFCKEMESSTYLASTTSLSLPRLTDSVMESPRLLPFPYHNDAYFLPTAEHDYPGNSTVTTDSSSMSSSRIGSRQYMTSLTSVNRGNFSRLQTPDSYRTATAGRVRPLEPAFEDWKYDYMKDQKHFMLRLKERILKSNTNNKGSVASSWYKRLWDRLSTAKPQIRKKASMVTLKPSRPPQFDTGMRKSTSCTPVWYSQFRCNPTPPPTQSVFLS